MNTVKHFQSLGVNLWLDGDDLRYSAPKEVLTPELYAELVERKAEILASLRAIDHTPPPPEHPPRADKARSGEIVVKPRTPIEKTLVEIWSQALDLERVGVCDNFFELGGDSIVSVQISARASQAGLDLAPWQVFEHQTIAELALVVGTASMDQPRPLLDALPALQTHHQQFGEAVEDVYPLSPMQHGMLFHTLYDPQSGAYVEQTVWTLSQGLDVAAFKRAWSKVFDRHSILRTAFVWDDLDQPLQVVQRRVSLPWQQQDWRRLSPAEQRTQLAGFLQADREKNFELAEAPLMRLALFQVTEDTYQFVWSYHHILLDGWSKQLVHREILAFYESFSRGTDLRLEQPRPYKAYIAWLQQQDMSEAEAFWKQMLAGFTAPTSLAIEQFSVGTFSQTADYCEQRTKLSATVTTALRSLARRHGLTLNTLVQGAWALLLNRYSGERDVIFGGTVSGRSGELAGIESMVGLFVNTLPVRVQISPQASLIPWLKRLQSQQVAARRYQYSPLAQIQRWSAVPPGMPLFESLLVFQNLPRDTTSRHWNDCLTIERRGFSSRTNYPLHITVGPGRDVSLGIHYHSNRFDAVSIERMLKHFRALLEGMAAQPDQKLSTLPLLTEAERHQMLIEWNDTRVAYPRDVGVHELFERQVERTPDRLAVVLESQGLSYRDLNRRANRLARYLRQRGIGPETLVGLCVERSLDMVVGLLGILKAGGAYVPLDPTYPQERLAYVLRDTQAPLLLTQRRLVERLPACQAELLCLDTDWDVIAQASSDNLVGGARMGNLAYVIYTSGSTGQPKGVAITHRGVGALIDWASRAFELELFQGTLASTSICFDLSVFELFVPLSCGGTVILTETALHLTETVGAERVKLVNTVPSALKGLLGVGSLPGSVRVVNLAGELLPTQLVDQLYQRGGVERVYDLYGPSEDTTYTTYTLRQEGAAPSIGRPIANTQTYVLDERLEPVPVGVPGELHLGGDGLARGYLNRPGLTAAKFRPNPFSPRPGARLYRTGDLARYLPDGEIEFLGRIDHQVKIRGFRIELGEVEAVLGQHPAVRETVVLARDAEGEPGADVAFAGEKRLVAYVVPGQEPAPPISQLRSYLKQKLPEYMIPSVFVMLAALPLTPSGKVDRRALPAPDGTRPELQKAFVAPRTAREKKLVEIWSQILGVKQIGIHDNFFELGGHSLLATQLASRVRRAFQVELPLPILFEMPTVAGLAQSIQAIGQAAQSRQTSTQPDDDYQEWEL